MTSSEPHGVVFPTGADGRRSTAALGRAALSDALRGVDPAGARAAEQETNWRAGYLTHFRRAVEAGIGSRADAHRIAADGLDGVRSRMRVALGEAGAEEMHLEDWADAPAAQGFGTGEVRGTAAAETELTIPYRGSRLGGEDLHRLLDRWEAEGVVEPSASQAVRTVLESPSWLRADGHTIAVLGAGAEMGPLRALLRWGAQVAAVDLPDEAVWQRVLESAQTGAGRVLFPLSPARDGDVPAGQAGADLIGAAPAVADWLASLGPEIPVVGNYVYADGATNVRVSVAVDVLTTRLQAARPDTALAFLATPTDVFAVPGDAVTASTRAYESRSATGRLLGRPLRTVSAGRLLRRAYVPGTEPGVIDSLVPQQGPNYALAKRIQRWRAVEARRAGAMVSMNVAPPTRTRSVLKNRALAAAYAGAHRFGVEVFDPATSNVLMAALLVHDLHTGGGPIHDHPWEDEAYAAVHGGLWRAAYAPRSALGLAALLGYGAARS